MATADLIAAYWRWNARVMFGAKRRARFYQALHDGFESSIPAFDMLSKMLEIEEENPLNKPWIVELLGRVGVSPARLSTPRSTRPMAIIYRDVMAAMQAGSDRGRALALGVARWVPAQEAAMIVGAAGVGQSVLSTTLSEAASLLGQQAEARSALLKSVGMGLVLIASSAALAAMVTSKLVGPVSSIITNNPAMAAAMPFATKFIDVSAWALRSGPYIVGAIVALGAVVAVSLPRWVGGAREVFDRLVLPYAVYQRFVATYFLSAASSLVNAGVPLDQVINDTGRHGTRYMRYYTERMAAALRAGEAPQVALAAGPLPNDTRTMLRVYELIPEFAPMMRRLADVNFKAYMASLKAVGVTMMLVAMLLTAIYAGSLIVAMFNLGDAARAVAS